MEKYFKVWAIISPVVSIFSFLLSLFSALYARNNLLLLLIFITVFASNIIFTVCLSILYPKYKALSDEHDKFKNEQTNEKNDIFNFLFSQNFRRLLFALKDSKNTIFNAYTEYINSIENGKISPKKEQIYYAEIKRRSYRFFNEVTNSLKKVLEYKIYKIFNEKIKISVCIKILNAYYTKTESGYISEDLKTFCVYRDTVSYQDDNRELGTLYTINKNQKFRDCLLKDNQNHRDSYFIENDVLRAIEEGRYECEDKEKLRNGDTYTASMLVPITRVRNTDKYFYGFLCIDAITDRKDLFNEKGFLTILQSYSELLAILFQEIDIFSDYNFDK